MTKGLKTLLCILVKGGHHKIFNHSEMRLECLGCDWKSNGIKPLTFEEIQKNIGEKENGINKEHKTLG